MVVSVRDSFVAAKGCYFLSFDYSQLEIRLMAHFSHDARLTDILKKGGDIFKAMASHWLDKAENLVK